jgi:hypothetical protein
VFTHDTATSRSHVRRLTLTGAVTVLLVLAGGALDAVAADTPEGWEKAPHVSGLEFLLVLLLIPVGIAAVISLLVVIPSLAGDHGYEPGQSWRGETQWFGGPRQGVAAADEVSPEQLEARSAGTGGSSGRW